MIYLDHAATTPVDDAVLEAMRPYFQTAYGNPSSLYRLGRQARQALDEARERAAEFLGCRPAEIIFTSGGSESDNLAVKGAAYARRQHGRHLVTSAIEHHAVLRAVEQLEEEGFEVTYLPVDEFGRVAPEALAEALREDTLLVSIMHANNEIGTLQPIAECAARARARGIPFHTDAVQTAGLRPLRVDNLGVDLLSLSAHKIYGPKGVGLLYVRSGTRLRPQIVGGGHERQRRAGTENVAGIVGLAAALDLCARHGAEWAAHTEALRGRLERGLRAACPQARLNGHPTERLPHLLNLCWPGVEGEDLLLLLDSRGIAASSGSACTSGALDPSHVLLALGRSRELARGSLRFSLGRGNTDAEIDTVLEELPPLVRRLTEQ
jgi:cysteine desulfurase